MKKLGDFLERFIKLAQSSDDAKTAVLDAVTKASIRIDMNIQNVTIRGAVVTLKLSPVQKSEISLKQGKILALLKENPMTKHITVVR